jgi:CheY-like chemotaxis protein
MRPASILVVDDDPDILYALSEALSEEGFSVQVAQNGQEALDLIGEAPPALILLDLMMPVMDGREFGSRIRSSPDLANIPIIVLSAGRDALSTAEDLDAAGYLGKPFDLSALLEMTHSAVSSLPG